MMGCTGRDLLKTFETLDIDLGNTNPEVIKAWFDSDFPNAYEFLSWLCCLNNENVLSVNEIEQYEKMVKRNEVLAGEEYHSTLEDLEQTYPGILDTEEQAFKINSMKDHVTALLIEEMEQENIITAQEHLNRKLNKSLSLTTNECIVLNINKRRAEEKCMSLSQQLDEVNTKFHLQLIKCSKKLKKCENNADPLYVSLAPLDEYNDHYSNILSNMNLLLKKEYDGLPTLETARKSCKKFNMTIFNSDYANHYLSTLNNRIFHSIQNKNYKEVTEQRLLAELNYLKNFKLFDVVKYAKNISFTLQIKKNVSLMNLHIDGQILELEDAARRASESLCNSMKLHFAQNETQVALSKFENLSLVNANVSKMLSFQLLVYLMHVSNYRDISETETFFRTLYHYVTNDLRECMLRAKVMQYKINNYDKKNNFILQKNHSLGKAFLKILSEYQDESSVCSLINKFKNEKNNLEMKLFSEDFKKFRQNTKKFECDIKLLKSVLVSGQTSDCIIVPYNLYKSLKDPKNTIKALETLMSSTKKKFSENFKQGTENKWLNMKRQLWTYFLYKPQMVSSFIAEIKAEVNAARTLTP